MGECPNQISSGVTVYRVSSDVKSKFHLDTKESLRLLGHVSSQRREKVQVLQRLSEWVDSQGQHYKVNEGNDCGGADGLFGKPESLLPTSPVETRSNGLIAWQNPWGVKDRRYNLHDASFGTLLLRVAGVLTRPNPTNNSHPAPAQHAPAKGVSDAQSDATDDNGSDDYEPGVGPVWKGAVSKQAQDIQQVVQENTRRLLEQAHGISARDNLCICFRELFAQVESGDPFDSREEYSTFKSFERLLSDDILRNDVAVVATTLVNSGHTILKESFKGDHMIVQEASKAENGDLFIALVECETSVHLSGDDEQLPPKEQDVARNPFARQSNKSLFKRWVVLGYPKHHLICQHSTIPVISDAISKIWYKGSVVSTLDQGRRPNAAAAIRSHQQLFDLRTPLIWIHTSGESNKVGFSQSSQNERELQVAIKLCQRYIEQGIKAADIVILAGYLAQVNLTRRAWR
ncbi:MAG: hypothetical protein Q9217_002842 [Psora testacea]